MKLRSQLTAPRALSGEGISTPSSSDPLLIHAIFEDAEVRAQLHSDWMIHSKSSLKFGVTLRKIDIPEAYAINNFDLKGIANENYSVQYYGQEYATFPVQLSSDRAVVGVYGQYQNALT